MNCPTSSKPPVERSCSERACGPEWFMADWGQVNIINKIILIKIPLIPISLEYQCSHNCGTGSQRRDVRCLDETQRPATQCPTELRPALRRACNTHTCSAGQGQSQYSELYR